MSQASDIASAREDTKAILANLQKGQILLATTSKDFKPTNFAWSAVDKNGNNNNDSALNDLKRISETASVFPVYTNLKKEKYISPMKSNAPPICYDNNLTAKNWESENHANYHDVKENMEPNATAGKADKEHVMLPTQFAWERMNVDGVSDKQEQLNVLNAIEERTAALQKMNSTRANVMATYKDAGAVSEWTSVSHADYPVDNANDAETSEQPECAGSPTKNADANPTYFAFGIDDAPTSAPKIPEGETKPSFADVSTHYKEQPQSEYNRMFQYESVTVQRVGKSENATLEGVFSSPSEVEVDSQAQADDFAVESEPVESTESESTETETAEEAPMDTIAQATAGDSERNLLGGITHYKVMPESEYDNKFRFEGIVESVEHVHKCNDATLDGVFSYEGIGSTMESENHAAYAFKTESVSARADDVAPVEEAAPAPVFQEEMAFEAAEEAAPVEEAPVPVEVVETAVSDDDVVSVASSNPWVAPDGVAEKLAPNPIVYQSTASSSFAWPNTVARPDRPIPVDHDQVGGTAAPAAQSPELQQEMSTTLSEQNNDRFTTEYNSHYAMPKENMNKRALNKGGKYPDSLWVLGTRDGAARREIVVETKARRPLGDAQIDHLRGSAAMPNASDSLDFRTIREPLVKKSSITAKDKVAGYVPGGEKNVLRSDGSPIPGQIPSLRELKDPVQAFNKLGGARRTSENLAMMGIPPGTNVADPIMMYQRYPMQSAKQANRFATTSRSSFKWPGQK